MNNATEIITLANGDLCARRVGTSRHVVIAHVATQPNSPSSTPEALREKAEAYALLADAVEAGWDSWAEARALDHERIRKFLTRQKEDT